MSLPKSLVAPSVLPKVFEVPEGLQTLAKESRKKPQLISEYIEALKKRDVLDLYNVCFIGHVDAGKSTTVARLLYDTGRVSKHVIDEFEKKAATLNKASFKFAWLMDQTKVERQRGVTIDIAHAEWNTENRYYTIIDAPGHEDYMSNMITGASQADLAVLVIDVQKGLIDGLNTEAHAFIARASGVDAIVVALNKFNCIGDIPTRMQKLKQVQEDALVMLKASGFPKQRIWFVPIDAWNGTNISDKTKNAEELPGYSGYSLVQALDKIPLPKPNIESPLRVSVQNTYTGIPGASLVTVGKVMSGMLVPGQELKIKPYGPVVKVKSIEMHRKSLAYASPNCNIGMELQLVGPGTLKKQLIPRASIICPSSLEASVKNVVEFEIKAALIREHPSELTVGANLIVHYQTGTACCEILQLKDLHYLDGENKGKFIEGPVKSAPRKTIVGIRLKVKSKDPKKEAIGIPIETKDQHLRNCRVILRDCNMTIGCGAVTKSVLNKNELSLSEQALVNPN